MNLDSKTIFMLIKLICGLAWIIIFALEYKKNKLNKNIYSIVLGLGIFLSGCYDLLKIWL